MKNLTVLTAATLSLVASSTANVRKEFIPEKDEQMQEYYKREEIPLPKGEVMEIGSIALMPNKRIAVATRRGDIWICDGAYGDDLTKVKWTLHFRSLHEPLGMFWRKGSLHFTDREQFGKLTDKNGDGRADEVKTIADGWGMTGDYHEYAFGSEPDKNGNVWIPLCLTGSFHAKAQWRGWVMKVTPEGKMTPACSGVRSPGGVGFGPDGTPFYTDNQGKWNGTSCVKPIIEGKFSGTPTANIFYKDAPHMGKRPAEPKSGSRIAIEAARIPEYTPPAVQIPHGKIGQSPTAILTENSKGKFGPFAGQMLIGEQTHSAVQRVFMEKVNGVYQGAVWKYLSNFRSGIVPMRQAEDGTLFVGGTNRGWSSLGGKGFTLERVRWKGKTPFEMKEMKAKPDGFELTFTQPVDKAKAADVKSYSMKAWTYIYQEKYGSPEVDHVIPTVTKATVSADGLSVRLTVDKLTKGHIHHLDAHGLTNQNGKKLWHPNSYYTLNQIPKK